MNSKLHDHIVAIVRTRGPITVAEFMDLALYHPNHGYYTRAAQRSGKHGDFFTNVDVTPLFGELVAEQLAEMWRLVRAAGSERFDLIEAGAGNGRLSRDILDAAAVRHTDFYRQIRLTLAERSDMARAAQRDTLGPHANRLVSSTSDLPRGIEGAVVANELLDAFPAHVLEMTDQGIREIVVGEQGGDLVELRAGVSDQMLLRDLPALDRGQRVEVSPAVTEWVLDAGLSLSRGFLLLFDYGYEPSAAYLRAHPQGTLMSYRAHRANENDWLTDPGERDLTAHVNLAAVRRAAERAGLTTVGIVDQIYFLLALGLAERIAAGSDAGATRQRAAARTLIMPGGLGDTMKAMIFAKGVDAAALRGVRTGRLT